MQNKSLRSYVATNGQVPTADRLGVTQGAVSQMILQQRDVILQVDDSGGIHYAYEIKQVGKFKTKKAA